jgi:hypothetical protein
MTELPTLFPELPSPWGWNASETRPLNPAVTIARALTNSFSGIAPADVHMFIVAQLADALAGLVVMRWFFAGSDVPARPATLVRA